MGADSVPLEKTMDTRSPPPDRSLTYDAQIGRVGSCPPSAAAPFAVPIVAYRMMHSPASAPINYEPPLVSNPSYCPPGQHCLRLALSYFRTREALSRRWTSQSLSHKNLHRLIGGWLASTTIHSSDGVADAPDANDHFNLWTYEGHTLEQHSALLELVAG